MIFLDPSSVSHTIPPPPKVYPVTGFFLIALDPTWTFPKFVQWDIEYQLTPNPLSVPYSPWTYAGSATLSSFSFFNINLANFYQFRYKIRTKNETSPVSSAINGGKVKVIMANIDGTFSIVES